MTYTMTKKELRRKLDEFNFSNFDLIIAVTDRGSVIADTISNQTNKLWLLASEIEGKINAKDTVLLVNDIISSGETMRMVKEKLGIKQSKTFAIAGNADFYFFDIAGSVKIKNGLLW